MKAPAIHLTDAASRILQDTAAETGGDPLRIVISDHFDYELRFEEATEADVLVDCGAVTVCLDPSSAERADGLSLDFVTGPQGDGFTIRNPNQPKVQQLSAPALKALIDSAQPFELVDVRTVEERAIAKIDGSRLLDNETHAYLLGLDRNTTIVCQCHHGSRSQSAAEHFLREGFRKVYNLQGGIDAWSQQVDSSVPRY